VKVSVCSFCHHKTWGKRRIFNNSLFLLSRVSQKADWNTNVKEIFKNNSRSNLMLVSFDQWVNYFKTTLYIRFGTRAAPIQVLIIILRSDILYPSSKFRILAWYCVPTYMYVHTCLVRNR
jgi:hypothetical protein